MSALESESSQWRLRVLNGPLRGAVVQLGRSTGLGRSPVADLQLVANGVSREHAMIAENPQGRHVLIDLASVNGTFVKGQRVDRLLLEPGAVFSIAGIEIQYEMAEPPASARATRRIYAVADSSSDLPIPREKEQSDAHPTRSDLPAQTTEVEPAIEPAAPPTRPVLFEGPDGEELGAELIDDIIEYRRLRSQHMRGGLASAVHRDRFERLQARLRQPPAPHPVSQRAFCRFTCWFPATVRASDGNDRPCWVRDFGVDGAQLKLDDNSLERDRIVWLALQLVADGHQRIEVLTSRVVWTDDDFVGLAFNGPPRSDMGRYTLGPTPGHSDHKTTPIQVDHLRLAPDDR